MPTDRLTLLRRRLATVQTDQSDLFYRNQARLREHIERLRKQRDAQLVLFDEAIANNERLLTLAESNRAAGQPLVDDLQRQIRVEENLARLIQLAKQTVCVIGKSRIMTETGISYSELDASGGEMSRETAMRILKEYLK